MAKQPRAFDGVFDAYTFVRQIGAGASGAVFEVVDPDGTRLALKLLTQTSRSKRKRFKNEINFCFKPISKQIIQVLDFGKVGDDGLFYVMPLYASTLKDRIESGISAQDVLGLFSKILDGVEAAHLLGVFHRDLKPANLLYAGPNDVVVADFGIAQFQESDLLTLVDTDSQERLANFRYSSPEQRTRGATVDQRADIFALGLILNEMFTGHVPQGSGYTQIKSVAPEFGYLDELVDSMIRQKATERPATISRVKEELIARGNRFVEFQRLEALKKQVVPESEVDDPVIGDPIRPVEAEGYSDGVLTIRLNRAINAKWEACFRARATSFSTNFSAAMIGFRQDSHAAQSSVQGRRKSTTVTMNTDSCTFAKKYIDFCHRYERFGPKSWLPEKWLLAEESALAAVHKPSPRKDSSENEQTSEDDP